MPQQTAARNGRTKTMPPYDKVKRLSPGDRAIPATTWNAFVSMYEDKYQTTSVTGDPLSRPVPPILSGSSIALAVLKQGQDDISGYSPVRITKVEVARDLAFALPLYEVEAVDAVDENGDPTDRHGSYAFAMAEGITKTGGGRIIVAGLAIVAVTKDQCVDGTEVGANYLGTPFDGYDGKYEGDYYVVPDGTILDDDKTLLAPIGHFKVTSWYDPDAIGVGKRASENIFFVIDMNQRFTSVSVEIFDSIAGYSGDFDDQTYNQGYAYVERPLEGVPAEIADVIPRVSNDGNEINTPSIKNGESNYFRCLVTNTHLYDVAPNGTYTVTYSRSLNRMIFAGDPLRNDGRIGAWYNGASTTERISRGRASGWFMYTSDWGQLDGGNTDTVPHTSYQRLLDEDCFADGRVMLSTDYMTDGGNNPAATWRAQMVPAKYADDLVPCIVLMLDADHEYATFCKEKCEEEGVMVSADYGEFKIVQAKPLHNNSTSGTYPQWNRCLGFLKNQNQMSGIVEIDAVNATAHTGTKHCVAPLLTVEGLKEVKTDTVRTNVIGLTRANHVDKMSQPQYQGSLNLVCKQSMSSTGDISLDSTTIYKFDCPTKLRVWGVDDAGAETEIDSSVWDVNPNALHDSGTLNFETVYNVNFFWEEKYKFIYFDIETDANSFSDVTGTISLHRRTNYGGDSSKS
ncbi:hypothetical protein OAF54_03625, partial [bacterium]|nr:hypothetical protein [bacterium]